MSREDQGKARKEKASSAERRERLAAELRENLKKRKARARAAGGRDGKDTKKS